jgi:hypothetical protein
MGSPAAGDPNMGIGDYDIDIPDDQHSRRLEVQSFIYESIVEHPPDSISKMRPYREHSRSKSVRILFPMIHKCSDRCIYDFCFGIPIRKKPRDAVCNLSYKIIRHSGIPFPIIPDASIWVPTGEFIKPNEIVIGDPLVSLVIDFPIETPHVVRLDSHNGFTRRQLIQLIYQNYERIYSEESETSTIRVTPIEQRVSLLNRENTDGRYRIFGYDLNQLWLESIIYDPIRKTIHLEIGTGP